ncbi:ankyrin repeat domain-containing protein [Caenispirillum bisanense]|uniref:Ankyrin repeat-containing protein n=1 Tax=Caenispirillum bisanense TaxID=414052 RepID=A0A286GU72_9PROT|nr:ankyrin repeat domain-containing protein [Caenispirillum bisanense]SOD99081.1 Ankyrin repeat-containing protein [Caenispirillum bisanense]
MVRRSAAVLAATLILLAAAPDAQANMIIRFEKEVVENIRDGNAQGLTAYLLGGGNPAATDNDGQPLLVVATRANRLDMIETLLHHGARPDAVDRLGNTALYWAAEAGHAHIVERLLTAGAKTDNQNRQGVTPLMAAARDGQVAVVRQLVTAGADPRLSDYTGRDAFGWAGGPQGNRVTAELNKAK